LTQSNGTATRADVLTILERLVAFNTVSDRSNLDLQDYVEAMLRAQGVDVVRVPNATGDKAALFATIGPTVDGGVVLSGHTDVVPVEGQNWSHDPFTLRVADGRAYGRGAVDMKAFAAIALATVPDMLKAPLRKPIHLMLSYDEETTCLGVVDTIAQMGHAIPRPGLVFVGEPTELEVADAHKGVTVFRTHVHGFEAHSSKPHLGAHAITGAVAFAAECDVIARELKAAGDPSGRFDPPFATLHIGMIHGGHARNILANLCVLDWEIRAVQGTDPFAVLARLDRFAAEKIIPDLTADGWPASVETQVLVDVPGLLPEAGSPAETLALRLAGRNQTITVPYGTEAGHFQKAGIPTIVCGPGSINQAHQPDEWISLDEIDRGLAFNRALIASLC
jgi:acetylornithine deacetylase